MNTGYPPQQYPPQQYPPQQYPPQQYPPQQYPPQQYPPQQYPPQQYPPQQYPPQGQQYPPQQYPPQQYPPQGQQYPPQDQQYQQYPPQDPNYQPPKCNMTQQQIDFIQNLFNNPQTGIQWVNDTFNRLKDSSGTIPRATFGPKIKEIAMSLGAPEPNPQSLEAAVSAADPDGDGKITYDEFKNFCVEAGDGLLLLLGL